MVFREDASSREKHAGNQLEVSLSTQFKSKFPTLYLVKQSHAPTKLLDTYWPMRMLRKEQGIRQ